MLIETLEFIKLQIFGVSFIKYFKLVSPKILNLKCKVTKFGMQSFSHDVESWTCQKF